MTKGSEREDDYKDKDNHEKYSIDKIIMMITMLLLMIIAIIVLSLSLSSLLTDIMMKLHSPPIML